MLCFYHGGDLDGKCSGAIVKYFNPECELIPFEHGREFPWDKTRNEVVYLVDMSLPLVDMIKLSEEYASELIWIDHHFTSIKEAKDKDFNPDGKREEGLAACELTWYFEANKHKKFDSLPKEMPTTVWLLGRYDVWDLKIDKRVVPFQLAMKAKDMDPRHSMNFWKYFFETNEYIPNMIKNGNAIHEYMSKENRDFMNSYSIDTNLDGLKVLAINRQRVNSAFFESKWDNKKYDLMLGFCRLNHGRDGPLWKVSMYTDKPGINVGQLAKKYGDYYGLGGGGHVQAAGFVVPGNLENLPFEV